jgi:histidinol-phosphate aminotransferase
MSAVIGDRPDVLGLVREDLRDFAGYSSARREASGGEVLLNANESPWPVPGDALGLNRYPAPQPPALLERLARLYGVATERLLVGRGSDEAIDLLVRATCRAGRDAVLVCPPTFGMYAVCARVQGAACIEVPLRADRQFALDVDAVLAALDPRVRLVFVCSPNNPTGAQVPLRDIERLAAGIAGRALLVVDEAYAEFADGPGALALAARDPHVAVLRTLSKAHALAGARIGVLAAAPELLAVLRAIMAPYPLPTPSVRAALDALQPAALALARSRVALVREERQRVAERLRDCAEVIEVLPSDANFLLVRLADAEAVFARAAAAGIVLRRPAAAAGLGGCLRISIGTPADNDRVLALLPRRGLRAGPPRRAAAGGARP